MTSLDVVAGTARWSIEASGVTPYLRSLPAACVRTCITSPPYFQLRDYGVDGQIGLEPTPEAYVAALVEVFREVRRVLAADGTLWLNIGDTYANDPPSRSDPGPRLEGRANVAMPRKTWRGVGLKKKDLIGIPWMLAFALRADGWYLRQDIIWAKKNPMPESVRDRCTKAHEYLFLLSKSERYYFNADAVKEEASGVGGGSSFGKQNHAVAGTLAQSRTYDRPAYATRNRRSVWHLSVERYRGAHFAVMPSKLVEPCVLAGSEPGDVILDPFCGSGTVPLVATQHLRRAIACDLNPEYVSLASERMTRFRGNP